MSLLPAVEATEPPAIGRVPRAGDAHASCSGSLEQCHHSVDDVALFAWSERRRLRLAEGLEQPLALPAVDSAFELGRLVAQERSDECDHHSSSASAEQVGEPQEDQQPHSQSDADHPVHEVDRVAHEAGLVDAHPDENESDDHRQVDDIFFGLYRRALCLGGLQDSSFVGPLSRIMSLPAAQA